MIFTHEGIASWRQRPYPHTACLVSGNDLFDLERGRIEFLGDIVAIGEDNQGRLIGPDVNLGRVEAVALKDQRNTRAFIAAARHGHKQDGG